MKKYWLLYLLLACIMIFGFTPAVTRSNVPEHIQWRQLQDVKFQPKYNKAYKMEIYYPLFGPDIKKLEGKQLSISGYMIPLDVSEGLYAISRYTYASCFFCGGAGVESVISLKFKNKPRRFATDQYCTIKGTLILNGSNVDDFIYIFKNAEEIKK